MLVVKRVKVERSPDYRKMVAKEYYTTLKTFSQLGREYGVNETTVYRWAQKYKSDFVTEDTVKQDVRTFESVKNTDSPMKKTKLTPEQMEQRIEELEARLQHEQMRRIVLDQMIDIAERDLKISIRKKSGAKQSK